MPHFDDLTKINDDFVKVYRQKNMILTFDECLDLCSADPRHYLRNAPQYILDVFDYYGTASVAHFAEPGLQRFKLFDLSTEKNIPIVGHENIQDEIYKILRKFSEAGYASRLILLHGPNGSSKSTTVEAIAHAMQEYSQKDQGAVYTFNWIFPSERSMKHPAFAESSPIGFSNSNSGHASFESFALLEEQKIASKIVSEFRENPLFLIPMPYRESLIRNWLAQQQKISPEAVEVPPHLLTSGLSKKNQQIFESLLNAYGGDMRSVWRHVQVERFFFSKQYRIGVSTVEPQMSIDAVEKQITMDRNYANLPAVLQTISFHQHMGEIVEANRGILEFSDLLKRPLEAFKYLLSTIEKSSINFPSGTAALDIVFLATTNEKHLDAFKAAPDFSSFRGRFEFINLPYLLQARLEEKIYARDIQAISKNKKMAPHSLDILCTWAVMTRLKQPEIDNYGQKYRELIPRIDPLIKARIFNEDNLERYFNHSEQQMIRELRPLLWHESLGTVVYEGRFGASPRELRSLLYRAAYNETRGDITPMAIFDELRLLIKNRTVYEFLQFEPRGKYHDVPLFIDLLEEEFCYMFHRELLAAMTIVDDKECSLLLRKYVTHVAALAKGEKVWDEATSSMQPPSLNMIEEIEKNFQVKSNSGFRDSILSRLAAYRIENGPQTEMDLQKVFPDLIQSIRNQVYQEKRPLIQKILQQIASRQTENPAQETNVAEQTLRNLQSQFGYSPEAAESCLRFFLKRSPTLI